MAAEAALNALKKLESNKTCANCDAYAKFGFQNVCDKFKTFVCGNCKSAHQSYSQRVKSVSMSNWTMEEVDALREENGGGNAVARRVWFARWDEAQMRKPTDKDHVDYFKKFINRVYNDQAFYDEDGNARSAAPSASSSSSATRRSSQRAAQPAAAAVNLLDFGSPTASAQPTFDAFQGSSASASNEWGQFSSAPAPAAAASSGGAFFADFNSAPTPAAPAANDGFGAFASAPAAPANDGFGAFASAPVQQQPGNDMFGAFASAPASAPAPSSSAPAFDPFAPTGNASFAPPAPVASSAGAFDPFAPSASTSSSSSSWSMGQQQQQAPPAPARPADFSAFDALSGPSQQQMYGRNMAMGSAGMHNGGVHNGGMHNMGMNSMGMQQHSGMHNTGMGQGYTNGGGFNQAPRPMMGGGNASANISTFMNPHGAATTGNSYGARPGGSSGSRDPFAGLGLPQ